MKTPEGIGLLPASLAWLKHCKARLFGRRHDRDEFAHPGAQARTFGPVFPRAATPRLLPDERRSLLDLAKKSIAAAARKLNPPEFDAANASANLLQPRGCFVTLHINGKLRGCIGQIFPRSPLYQAVLSHARNAATGDPRFEPVQPGEVDRAEIEISVLSEPQPLEFDSPEEILAQLTPLTDGVVLQIDGRIATFLPQVWVGIPDKVVFMESLSRKAESDPDGWRSPDAGVSTYQAESFTLRP